MAFVGGKKPNEEGAPLHVFERIDCEFMKLYISIVQTSPLSGNLTINL
jgi:hypothetical protein